MGELLNRASPGAGYFVKEALKDWHAFFKYGSMLAAMLVAILLYVFAGYLIVSFAYTTGGMIAGLTITLVITLLSIGIGRRISSA